MRLFGFEIGRAVAATEAKALSTVDGRGGWFPVLREFAAGAWQANLEVSLENSLGYWVQFRCISMISSDIAKMRIRLVEQDDDGVWSEAEVAAFSPVLRKPNAYQNRIQFFESWMQSKLSRGNTYALKRRDNRGVVIALYVLDPALVRPMVAQDGAVFYELRKDYLSGLDGEGLLVPASEIIHDRWNTLYHPLVGLSPIYANAMVALSGKRMTTNSARFFGNGARPSGVLVAPGSISDKTAQALKEYWDSNFSGDNAGKVAVLGDGLKYEQMTMTAVDAQLIDQLKWGDTTIAGSYGVPAYMLNAGAPPAYNNVQALAQQYYSQCLQIHIESIELCLDEGLGLHSAIGAEGRTRRLGTEFDLDDLLRMDSATQYEALEKAKSLLTLNERRRKAGAAALPGGDTIYMQQQDHSMEAIAARDRQLVDQAEAPKAVPPAAPPSAAEDDETTERRLLSAIEKQWTKADAA